MPEDPEAWPTRRDMIQELSKALGRDLPQRTTCDNWKRAGCPLPGRKPIPKVPVLLWLLVDKREKGRGGHAGAGNTDRNLQDRESEQRIRLLENRNRVMEDQSWNRDEVTKSVLTAVAEIKTLMYTDFISTAFDQAQDMTATAFEEHMKAHLDGSFDRLTRFVEEHKSDGIYDDEPAEIPGAKKKKPAKKKPAKKKPAKKKKQAKA